MAASESKDILFSSDSGIPVVSSFHSMYEFSLMAKANSQKCSRSLSDVQERLSDAWQSS